MNILTKKLQTLTGDLLACKDLNSEEGKRLQVEVKALQELSKAHKIFENIGVTDIRLKERLALLTKNLLAHDNEDASSYIDEISALVDLVKVLDTSGAIVVDAAEREAERKSNQTWDDESKKGGLTTAIKLTSKQKECLAFLDAGVYDKFLALGGSGSGKSFVLAYKIIRDTLRYKAPCLIARDKLVDLTQGMIDQIIPVILTLIAQANGQQRWETWTIDGLKFAKWTDKKTKLDFATGGYIRCAGLSARDLSESGSDKILSPSWLHILLEEISELEYATVEKVITRLRYSAGGVLNTLMMCENPPSINHWSYKRFFLSKREDGSKIADDEAATMSYILMNPGDNVENLGETYIRNLSHMTGANRERFYLGRFQDQEEGEIFKRIDWTDNMPRRDMWDKICLYTDPTPLTGKEHSQWADYKASVLVGLWQGQTFVLDLRIVKGSTLAMLQNIKQLFDASPDQSITEVVIEKKQVPSDFNQVMATFSAMTNWVCPIKWDTRHFTDKRQSIETFLEPLFENEMIHFNEAFRDTDRGGQTQLQILKFSRKENKMIHDDIPDAIMRADTWMKGRRIRRRNIKVTDLVNFVKPAYIQTQ